MNATAQIVGHVLHIKYRRVKTVCPFCKKRVTSEHFWKSDSWSRGCFNPACKIRPMTRCFNSKEEAEKEWNDAFVSGRRR